MSSDKYMLLAERGINPPKYTHHNIDLAIAEAKRLNNQGLGKVLILKVVAQVDKKEVPVTRLEQFIEYLNNWDELPF